MSNRKVMSDTWELFIRNEPISWHSRFQSWLRPPSSHRPRILIELLARNGLPYCCSFSIVGEEVVVPTSTRVDTATVKNLLILFSLYATSSDDKYLITLNEVLYLINDPTLVYRLYPSNLNTAIPDYPNITTDK